MKLKFYFVLILAFLTSVVGAEEAKPNESKPVDPCDTVVEQVTKGNVASMSSVNPGISSVNSDSGGAVPGDKQSAVAASVNYITDTKCEVKFENTSKCYKYSVSYEVNSSKANGSFVRSSSVTLDPGKSKASNFTCDRELSYSIKIIKSSGTRIKKSK